MMALTYTPEQREALIAQRLAYLSAAIRRVPFGTEQQSFAFQAFLCLTNFALTQFPDTPPLRVTPAKIAAGGLRVVEGRKKRKDRDIGGGLSDDR